MHPFVPTMPHRARKQWKNIHYTCQLRAQASMHGTQWPKTLFKGKKHMYKQVGCSMQVEHDTTARPHLT
eukprot:357392-Chlamydomonas_euryale.AAC.42